MEGKSEVQMDWTSCTYKYVSEYFFVFVLIVFLECQTAVFFYPGTPGSVLRKILEKLAKSQLATAAAFASEGLWLNDGY